MTIHDKSKPPGAEVAKETEQANTRNGIVLAGMNAARAAAGLGPLGISAELADAAQAHADDMAERNYFAYSPPNNAAEGVEARIVASGYKGRTGVNLSRGREDPAEIVAALLADDTTKSSVLNATYRELGVGAAQTYWAFIFGSPPRMVTPELQQRARDLLNSHRAAQSLPQVELSPALNYAAQRHSLDMATRRFVGHNGSDGSTPTLRVHEARYEGTAEQLLASDGDLEAAFAKWFADAAQGGILLGAAARQIGLGMAEGQITILIGTPTTVAVNTTTDLQGKVVELLNGHRQTINVPPLSLHPGLSAAAAAHSQDMADKDYFAFEQPGRPGIGAHMKQSGYRGRTLPAITMGQTTAEAVVQLLLNNAGHRRSLLDADNRDLGLGVVRSRWTLILGAPPAEASADLRGQLLTLLNAQRATSTAPPMELSPLLSMVAQNYADDMARRNYFAFQTPEGEALTTQAQRSGYSGRTVPALVKGYSSAAAALDTWMKSPQNRQNLLDPQLVHLGIGVADSRWVLLLGMVPASPTVPG